MAVLEIVNSVRRIVHKWVNTSSRAVSGINSGDTVIYVENSYRFNPGDEIILRNDQVYEVDLSIYSVDRDANTITLASPVLNDWDAVTTIVTKAFYGNYVQGIYVGNRDVIPKFPCVTVNAVSRNSEWMTLDSTKERYQIELTVYVQADTQEKGTKFLWSITDLIQKGLKRNIMPLVEDYNITSLAEDVSKGDFVIKVNNRELLENSNFIRFILEDEYNSQEHWVERIFSTSEDPSGESLKMSSPSCFDFSVSDTSVIIPQRHIFNSWPNEIQYGYIHKGELLKAAKISWFAEEEELQNMRWQEPKLR